MLRCLTLVLSLLASQLTAQSVDIPVPPKSGNPKLDSHLNRIISDLSSKKLATQPAGALNPRAVVTLVPEPGRPLSSIRLEDLEVLGGELLGRSASLARVSLPLSSLEAATEIPGVFFVRPPHRPLLQFEGVMRVNAWRSIRERNVRGQRVHIAIIDFGFAEADRLRSRFFPQNRSVRDFTGLGIYSGESKHGTACTEIAYDIAPDAEYHLLRIEDLVDFENAKDYCLQNGVQVVSFSGLWPSTGYGDGEGLACDIVNDAADNGILWVNAAGNLAQRQLEKPWLDGDGDGWHDFGPGQEVLPLEETEVGDSIVLWLTWNEWPRSHNDYDLYLCRLGDSEELEIVAESTTTQEGSEPIESIEFEVPSDGTYAVMVAKSPDARPQRFKVISGHQNLGSGSLYSTIGVPGDARGALTVGAVDAYQWHEGPLEPYSSRGPTADGRLKPDLVGPTGISTSVFGRNGFKGTSGATPNVAGAAALLKSAYPHYGRDELYETLLNSTWEIGEEGWDYLYGRGKLVLTLLPAIPLMRELNTAEQAFNRAVVIKGSYFGSLRRDSKVMFSNGVRPDPWHYLAWGREEIQVRVPVGAESGDIRVFVANRESNTLPLTVTSPLVTRISNSSVRFGDRLRLWGKNFGSQRGTGWVFVGGRKALSYGAWRDGLIELDVPADARSGHIIVHTGVGPSNPVEIDVVSPVLVLLAPRTVHNGDLLTIWGSNFGDQRRSGFVQLGDLRLTASQYVTWADKKIVVRIPWEARSGAIKVWTESGESPSKEIEVAAPEPQTTVAGQLAGGLPLRSQLGIPFPSPFNAEVAIPFEVAEETQTTIQVYNISGQQITTLYDEFTSAGRHQIVWHGRSASGRDSATGLYFVQMTTPQVRSVRRIALIR